MWDQETQHLKVCGATEVPHSGPSGGKLLHLISRLGGVVLEHQLTGERVSLDASSRIHFGGAMGVP